MTNPSSRRPLRRAWAAAAAVAAATGLLASCTTGSNPGDNIQTVVKTVSPTTPSDAGTSAQSGAPTSGSSDPAKPKKVVKVTSLLSDGAQYGVGMPIVLYLSPLPTDSTAFTNAVKVTVNGKPAAGAWYWEQPDADEVKNHVVEAHYRPETYWPAHSQIHVDIPIGGLSAGTTKKYDLVYSNKLTSLDYSIGAAHISTVDAANGEMTVKSDDKVVNKFRAGLGASQTPTYKGVKVVMQKGEDKPGTNTPRPNGAVTMQGPGYGPELVDWSVRITQSGEYVHAAPWNPNQTATSNGCTNLSTSNAKWFYGFSQIGDVVKYPNAPGAQMRPDDGLGDWNVPWTTWQRGGLLLNH